MPFFNYKITIDSLVAKKLFQHKEFQEAIAQLWASYYFQPVQDKTRKEIEIEFEKLKKKYSISEKIKIKISSDTLYITMNNNCLSRVKYPRINSWACNWKH